MRLAIRRLGIGTNYGCNVWLSWLILGYEISDGYTTVRNILLYEISLSSYEITLSTTVRNILLRYEIALSSYLLTSGFLLHSAFHTPARMERRI